MKKYDANFIFVQTGRDEAWAKTIERMQAEITRIGGKVLDTQDRGKKTFARIQQKKESGTYLTIRFELDPVKVNELRARYALIEEIFRLQILAIDPIVELKLAKQAAEKKARAEANAKAAESAEA
ncbi:MAG: 30S ribosomal protein S6 [Kiritimatiellae bacterium]|jgi:small subunit ribosomal protein S6|nr:30S ribosomal protein S6 [Kiritimatiellia bacterium]